MGECVGATVELPLWLVVIVGVLSLLAALDHLLLPSARWVMRRRLNRAIEELNTRLKLRIQPFKLAKRQSLIDQLIQELELTTVIETTVPHQLICNLIRERILREGPARPEDCFEFRILSEKLATGEPVETFYQSAVYQVLDPSPRGLER